MLVDMHKAPALSGHDYPSVPDWNVSPSKRFACADVTINYYRNVRTASGEDYVCIAHSLVAFHDGVPRFAVSVEKQDLRSLSSLLGTQLRDLQKEYGVKGYLTEGAVILYGNGEREEMGALQTEEKEEYLLPYLFDILLDSIDYIEEVVPLN
ncbi:MAG: hypothetical protein ACI4NM_12320 [Bullifex sp.]